MIIRILNFMILFNKILIVSILEIKIHLDLLSILMNVIPR